MEERLLINIHSFVDVITNSSTELFICNTEKTLDAIREQLYELVNYWNAGVEKGINSRLVDIEDFKVEVYTQEVFNKFSKEKEEYIKNDKDGFYAKYGYGWAYERQENVGKILISGTEDNIIPYEMFAQIETIFNATRYHLG
jgi:hypothetical protein